MEREGTHCWLEFSASTTTLRSWAYLPTYIKANALAPLTHRHRWYLTFWALHLALRMLKHTGLSPSLDELLIWEGQTSEQVDAVHENTLKYRISTEKAMSPRVRKAPWLRG